MSNNENTDTGQHRWDQFVERAGEPKRFEDWKTEAVVYGSLLLLAVIGGVSLWLFLSGRVG